MQISCVEMVELPFMLNIPAGKYLIGGQADPYELSVKQEHVVGHLDAKTFFVCAGDNATIANAKSTLDVKHWQRLRTLVEHESVQTLSEEQLPLVDSKKLFEAMQRVILLERHQ